MRLAVQIFICLMVVAFGVLAIAPLLWNSNQLEPHSGKTADLLRQIDEYWLLAFWVFLGAWVFFVGACFASFLNVVAWRMPRGLSIIGSSRCPNCQTPISLRQNLPVFGWLLQEGRSKCCRQPISARYLWVEICLGSIFLAIATWELSTCFAYMPDWVGPRPQRIVWFRPHHWALLISHLSLATFLFTVCLFQFTAARIPRSVLLWTTGWGAIIGGLTIFLLPQVHVSAWVWRGLVGLSVGWLVGIGEIWFRQGSREVHARDDLSMNIAQGVWVGWLTSVEGVLAVGIAVLLSGLVITGISRGKRHPGWSDSGWRWLVSLLLLLGLWRFWSYMLAVVGIASGG